MQCKTQTDIQIQKYRVKWVDKPGNPNPDVSRQPPKSIRNSTQDRPCSTTVINFYCIYSVWYILCIPVCSVFSVSYVYGHVAWFKLNDGDDDCQSQLKLFWFYDGRGLIAGKEIRSILDEKVAQLYFDLDGGFSAMAWLLPPWVPLPSFRWVPVTSVVKIDLLTSCCESLHLPLEFASKNIQMSLSNKNL